VLFELGARHITCNMNAVISKHGSTIAAHHSGAQGLASPFPSSNNSLFSSVYSHQLSFDNSWSTTRFVQGSPREVSIICDTVFNDNIKLPKSLVPSYNFATIATQSFLHYLLYQFARIDPLGDPELFMFFIEPSGYTLSNREALLEQRFYKHLRDYFTALEFNQQQNCNIDNSSVLTPIVPLFMVNYYIMHLHLARVHHYSTSSKLASSVPPSLDALNDTTGIVVDMGYDSLRVAIVVKGSEHVYARQVIPMYGCKHIIEETLYAIVQRTNSMGITIKKSSLDMIVKKLCFVNTSTRREQQQQQQEAAAASSSTSSCQDDEVNLYDTACFSEESGHAHYKWSVFESLLTMVVDAIARAATRIVKVMLQYQGHNKAASPLLLPVLVTGCLSSLANMKQRIANELKEVQGSYYNQTNKGSGSYTFEMLQMNGVGHEQQTSSRNNPMFILMEAMSDECKQWIMNLVIEKWLDEGGKKLVQTGGGLVIIKTTALNSQVEVDYSVGEALLALTSTNMKQKNSNEQFRGKFTDIKIVCC